MLDYICRACAMVIAKYEHTFDLILLDMVELYVTIVMNWLTCFRVVIEFYVRRMTFITPKGAQLQFQVDRLSIRRIEPLEALITSMWNEETSTQAVAFLRVVKEYISVFPDELPRLPPYREIEFAIDTLPGISPIALLVYRMAPANSRDTGSNSQVREAGIHLQEQVSLGSTCIVRQEKGWYP